MSDKQEELIEEIAREVYFGPLYDGRNYEKARARARRVITRIGKAVLSGEYPELDELLGVVGRGNGCALVFEDGDIYATWTEAFEVDKSCKDEERLRFIALRPGVMKEEK